MPDTRIVRRTKLPKEIQPVFGKQCAKESKTRKRERTAALPKFWHTNDRIKKLVSGVALPRRSISGGTVCILPPGEIPQRTHARNHYLHACKSTPRVRSKNDNSSSFMSTVQTKHTRGGIGFYGVPKKVCPSDWTV